MASSGPVLGLATPDGRRPQIAVVGGSPAGAMVAGVLIEQFGGAPVSAPTTETVLTLLARDRPPDLVLIDLSASETDGMEAVRRIRAFGGHRQPPIIGLTDRPAERAAPQPHSPALDGTVIKPYSPRELYTALYAALFGPATVVAGSA